jgi:hypothetical protein
MAQFALVFRAARRDDPDQLIGIDGGGGTQAD